MKLRKDKWYLYVWEIDKPQEMGCVGTFKNAKAAEDHFLFIGRQHNDKFLKGELRREIG